MLKKDVVADVCDSHVQLNDFSECLSVVGFISFAAHQTEIVAYRFVKFTVEQFVLKVK